MSGYSGGGETWDYITANVGTTYTWDGGATTGGTQNYLNNNLNWAGDIAPTSGTSTKISFDGSTRLSPDLNVDFTLNGALVNNSGTNSYAGTISGTGTVTVTTGGLTLSGTAANTYTGVTTVNDGTLTLAKTAGLNAVAGNLTIGDGSGAASSAIVQLTNANQIADTAAVTLLVDGRFDLNSQNVTVGSVATASSAPTSNLVPARSPPAVATPRPTLPAPSPGLAVL